MLTPRDFFRLCTAIAMRPSLWITTVRQSLRLARHDWWKTSPFLPLPSPAYVAFRMVTQYGTPTATPEIADVLDYLEWCRDWDSTNRPEKGRRG
jgi:hypothetical protein